MLSRSMSIASPPPFPSPSNLALFRRSEELVSIASNIAEGAKRQSRREYVRFLNVAEGSLAETESLLRLSRDLGFTDDQVAGGLVKEAEDLSRML